MKNRFRIRIPKQKIRYGRILMMMMLFVIISFCAVSLYINQLDSALLKNMQIYMMEIANHDARNVDNELKKNWEILDSIAEKLKLEAYKDTDEIWHLLNLEIKATGFSELLLVDEEGSVYKNGNRIWEMQDDITARRFLVNKEPFVFLNYQPKDEKHQDWLNNNITIEKNNLLYAQPMEITIIGREKYIGIIGFYDLDSIRISMQNQFYYNKGLAQVVNTDGVVIATENAWEGREPENLLSEINNAEFLEGDSYVEIQEKIKNREEISSVFIQNGEKMILIAEPIEKADWMVVTTIPISVMENQTLVVLRMTLILLTLFAVIIGVLLLYGFFRYRSRMFRKNSREIYYRERLFNLLSIHTDDVFAVVNKVSGEVQFVSENIKRTMGVDISEYKEKYAMDLALSRDIRADAKRQIEKLVQEENEDTQKHADFEFEWKMPKTEETKWLHTTVYLVKENIFDSTEGCLILIISDYTKVRENQKTLESAIKEAQEAVRSRSSFLSNMSHEMRTPLNGIIGCINVMQKRIYDPVALKSYLYKAELTANYLLTLINDVLDMSKIESKKLTLEMQNVHLKNLLENVKGIFEVQAEEKNIQFEVHTDNLLWDVEGDAHRIQQIVVNLLSNAFKFTATGGKIKVKVCEEPLNEKEISLNLSVSDSGCGMSPEFLERIWSPFEQERLDTARRYGGSGLGLAITYELVRLMKGNISVASKLGEGSQFKVVMPLKILNKAGEAERLQEAIGRKDWMKDKTILVAEDNELNMDILKTLLEEQGVRVISAFNGREALQKFLDSELYEIDAILMDMQMPVMDGCEAALEIRKAQREDALQISIIACTANAFTEDADRVRKAGMDAHMIKPLDMEKLYTVLKSTNKSKRSK